MPYQETALVKADINFNTLYTANDAVRAAVARGLLPSTLIRPIQKALDKAGAEFDRQHELDQRQRQR